MLVCQIHSWQATPFFPSVFFFFLFPRVLRCTNWWNSRKPLWFFCTFMVISVLSLLRQTRGSFSERRITAALTAAYCAAFPPPLFMDARCFSALVSRDSVTHADERHLHKLPNMLCTWADYTSRFKLAGGTFSCITILRHLTHRVHLHLDHQNGDHRRRKTTQTPW